MSSSRKLLNSWWILLSLLGVGCLSGLGFIIIGLRARRPVWWLTGLGYTAATWTLWILFDRFPQDSEPRKSIALAFFAVWAMSIVHSLVLNRSWLRWVESRQPARPLAPPPGFPVPPGAFPAPSGGPVPASGDLSGIGGVGGIGGTVPSPAAYYGPGPAAAVPGAVAAPTGAPAYGPAPAAASPGIASPGIASPGPAFSGPAPSGPAVPVFGPVDVNTATAERLAGFGEFDLARAQRIVADREVRGGFGSVEEFAAVAQLAPHQFARLRHQVTCHPRPATGPTPPAGRVLDL